jgi:hypothetical protein
VTKKKELQEPSHTVVIKDGLRIEILENTDYLAYGPGEPSHDPGKRGTAGTHHLIFIIGGPGIENLYYAQVKAKIADGPTADLIDYLMGGVNTGRVKFLKRFNVVSP